MRAVAQRLVLIAMSIVLCAVMAWAIASGQCPWWLVVAGAALGLVSAGFAVWVALAPVEQLRSVWKQSWW